MKTVSYACRALLAAGLLAASVAHAQQYTPSQSAYVPPAAADMSYLPAEQRAGNVAYITGGVGDEERAALEAVRSKYNLHVMSATTGGYFAQDAAITIKDHTGTPIITAQAGPLFYASLPPGKYVLEASNAGQDKRQSFTVGNGKPAHVHLGWNMPQ